MRVDVYYNTAERTFSVRKQGLVINHLDIVCLDAASFVVSEVRRQRVLREKRKNVHAVVRGVLTDFNPTARNAVKVSYNPYFAGHFYRCDNKSPVKRAQKVWMEMTDEGPKVYALEVE